MRRLLVSNPKQTRERGCFFAARFDAVGDAAAVAGIVLALVASGCGMRAADVRKADEEGRALRLELAALLVKKGSHDAAVPLLRRVVADEPRNPVAHYLYGTVLRERGLYPQAERELFETIRLDENYAPAHAALGILYDIQRRSEDAEREHRRAIELAPRYADYWNNLGFSYYVAGRTDEAITALETALGIDPSLAIAHNNLGFAYGRQNEYDKAARCFRNAGGELMAYLNLALVYEQNGDPEMAAKLRTEARVLDPNLPEVNQ
ncbi:MAG: tetratricopeptide repeat protein [Pseudomonadota bacterium]